MSGLATEDGATLCQRESVPGKRGNYHALGLRVGRQAGVAPCRVVAGATRVQSSLGNTLRCGLVNVVVLTPPGAHTSSEVGDAQVSVPASPLVEDAQEKHARHGPEEQVHNGNASTECKLAREVHSKRYYVHQDCTQVYG